MVIDETKIYAPHMYDIECDSNYSLRKSYNYGNSQKNNVFKFRRNNWELYNNSQNRSDDNYPIITKRRRVYTNHYNYNNVMAINKNNEILLTTKLLNKIKNIITCICN